MFDQQAAAGVAVPVTTATPETIAANAGSSVNMQPAALFTINHAIDYNRLRNLLLIVIAVGAGAKLLLMLISYMLEKK